MRNRIWRWIVPLMLLGIVWGCAQQAPAPPVDATAIRAAADSLDQAFAKAIAARDTEAVVAFYADDAKLLPANGPRVDGHDGIRSVWAAFMGLPDLEMTLQSRDVVISDAGDVAIDLGSYAMKWNDAKGKPMQDVGKYVTVFKRSDTGWKIVVDTWNSDQPLPGM